MAVKIPPLLSKMSKSAQKAWYKRNNMEMPDEPVERSAAAAKKVKIAPRKASDVKPDSVRAINTARMAAYMAKGGRAPIGAAGSGGSSVMAGSNMSTVRGIITGIKAGFNPTVSLDPYESERAKKTGPRSLKLKKEEVEQVDEGSKRMSAAVKLQRAFDREKAASDASRKRGEEMLAQARAEYAKKQAAKTNEEVEQVDEATKRALNITKADLEVIKSGNHETVKNHMAKMISRATDHKTNARPLRSDKAKEFLDKIHGSTNVGQLQKMAYNIYLGGDDEGKAKYGKLHVYNPQSAKGRDYQKRYGIGEEVEQVDEVNYKKYLKVSQEKRPLTPSAVAVAMSAEKEGNPNPVRKLRNTQDARKFANKQLTKQFAKTRPAQKFPVYEPGRKYVGDSVELDGPVIDENNLKSLKAEDAKMKYIEEKLTAADPASKYIKDFVASENPKFAEKSKKERISMALGAYYAAKGKKNEEVEQINEGPSHFLYSGEVNSKNYEYVVPARKVLGNGLDDDDIHKALKRNDNNDHLEHHEIKAIVDSQGEPDSHVEVTHKGKHIHIM